MLLFNLPSRFRMRNETSAPKALALGLCFAILALAQSGTSSISGTIKDATGATIAGAAIKVINEQTGSRQDTAANESGTFRAGSLLPGSYRLEIESSGFQKLVRGPLTVEVDQSVALDLTLQLGNASETVTVTEEAPMVESQTSTMGQAVSRQMLAGLPLPNRAASSLARTARSTKSPSPASRAPMGKRSRC